VVICVRNGASLIPRQLRALASQQTAVQWELVVVDNGSTDATVAVVRDMALELPVPVRIVDASARTGICHARNVGASAARGALLAFCDCDDEVAPGWVDAAAAALEEYDVVAGGLRELGEGAGAAPAVIEGGAFIEATFGGAVIGCNFAVRRDAYFAIGGFDESLPPYGCDDVEFSLRANEAQLTVGKRDDMVVHFRRTTGTRELLRKTYLSAQAEALVWRRHPDRYGHLARPGRIVGRALTAVPSAVVSLVGGGPARVVVRGVVTRWGNLVGWWRLVRNDTVGPELVHRPLTTREA
jgi:glycosyltransferase involved in cell wall biosynthesis